MKKILVLLLSGVCGTSLAYSPTPAEIGSVYKKILKANGLKSYPPLYYQMNNVPNAAYATQGYIKFNSGMGAVVRNKDELAWVLSHELGHFVLKTGGTPKTEMDADKVGATLSRRAGFNSCNGVKLLRRFVGDPQHAPGEVRYNSVRCR
jgi:predicted Zn-dependent protease